MRIKNTIYSNEINLPNKKKFKLYNILMAFTCRFFSITLKFALNVV
jgi:hypothetical protein